MHDLLTSSIDPLENTGSLGHADLNVDIFHYLFFKKPWSLEKRLQSKQRVVFARILIFAQELKLYRWQQIMACCFPRSNGLLYFICSRSSVVCQAPKFICGSFHQGQMVSCEKEGTEESVREGDVTAEPRFSVRARPAVAGFRDEGRGHKPRHVGASKAGKGKRTDSPPEPPGGT